MNKDGGCLRDPRPNRMAQVGPLQSTRQKVDKRKQNQPKIIIKDFKKLNKTLTTLLNKFKYEIIRVNYFYLTMKFIILLLNVSLFR